MILCTSEQIKRVVIKILGHITNASTEEIRNDLLIGLFIVGIVLIIEFFVIKMLIQMKKKLADKKISWLLAYIK